jgi:UTP--glucose-1-phosphate uridylyltransferase
MLAVTGGLPKELLVLGSRCVLARIIEEARAAGLDGAVVVNAREKGQVDAAVDSWSRTMFADFPLRIAYQDEARGLGHAVASAMADDDAIVMVGDVVYAGGSPTERMANLIHRGIDGCVAVEPVEEADMHLYGIVELDDMTGSILKILEKPSPSETSSRWAVAGRWAFSKLAMAFLAEYCRDPDRLAISKEINLTEIINLAIQNGMEFKAVALQPGQERVDCGSAAEYETARRRRWD